MKTNRILLSLALMLSVALVQADELYVGLQDGTLNAVAELTGSLSLTAQRTMPGAVHGLAAGPAGSFFVGIGNGVYRYIDAGTQTASILASPTTAFRALAANNGAIYCGLADGSLNAVAKCTLTLTFVNQSAVAGPVSGLAAGPYGTYFVASGNKIYKYSDPGAILASLAGSATTVMRDAAYNGSQLYVSLQDNGLNAVAILNSNLGLIRQINLPNGLITALAADAHGEFYAASANVIYHYDANGNLLGSIVGSPTTKFIDMAYYASPTRASRPAKPIVGKLP